MKKVLIPLAIILAVVLLGGIQNAQKELPLEAQLRTAGNIPAVAEITTIQTLEAEDGTAFLWFEADQEGPYLARIDPDSSIHINHSFLMSQVPDVWQNWEIIDGEHGFLFLCENPDADHIKWRCEGAETWETTPFPEVPSMVFLPLLDNGTTEYYLCDKDGTELHT